MQDRPEHLIGEVLGAREFKNMWRDEIAAGCDAGEMYARLLGHACDMRIELLLCLGVDYRSDMGGGIVDIAELQLARCADGHLDVAVGAVVLHEQEPQLRAARPGAAKRR